MLKEEIKRIKELFDDNRLYGNLVNEACTEQEALDTLHALNKYDIKADSDIDTECLAPGSLLKKLYDYYQTNKSTMHLKVIRPGKQGNYCYLEVNRIGKWSDGTKYKQRLVVYEDDKIAKATYETVDPNEQLPANLIKLMGWKGSEITNRIRVQGLYDDSDIDIAFNLRPIKERGLDMKEKPVLNLSNFKGTSKVLFK